MHSKQSRDYSADDVLCFSHLRWNFVFQRPQHLMTRCAKEARVFFIEEPIYDSTGSARLELRLTDGVHVVVPHFPVGTPPAEVAWRQRKLLRKLCDQFAVEKPLAWFYTPLSLPLIEGLDVSSVVYDCMDDLSGFAMASPELGVRERELLDRASVVFTGGQSLFEAKRRLHANVHAMPSSVDVAHFAKARSRCDEPEDQRPLSRPRVGFCGVIDERMDLDLVRDVATQMPSWQFIMIGPIVKIDAALVPQGPNIHYLGMKAYDTLPSYLSRWDVAMLPFARNRATQFISPTKTPEYLAAGCPVVSTSIRDVVRPYGEQGFVSIADTPADFARAIISAVGPAGRQGVERAAPFLATMSWDRTWTSMRRLVDAAMAGAVRRRQPSATVATLTPAAMPV